MGCCNCCNTLTKKGGCCDSKKIQTTKKGGCCDNKKKVCCDNKKTKAQKKGKCCDSKKTKAPKKGKCCDSKKAVKSQDAPEITIAVGGKKVTIKIEDLN